MAGIGVVLDEFRAAWPTPRDGVGDNPFRLACELSEPATQEEIAAAWPKSDVPREVLEFWSVCREASLFVDVDYGQWGVHFLSPSESARRTDNERLARESDLSPHDVVLAEFLGDQDLLVVSQEKDEESRILIALPLDGRQAWYDVGHSLEEFLRQYLASNGQKFWESGQG